MSTNTQSKVRLRTTIVATAVATALPMGMANATAEAEPPASTPDTSFGPKHVMVEWVDACGIHHRPPMEDAVGCVQGG